ncbi:MAG: VRR-NUC domain-containing protein [Gammaproteobacteria bacterium]|nr:VRR-NUC domain-containing protein [Gammaproteobacteria bacterium]
MAKILLEQDYYLTNIKALLDFVAQRYHFLLSKQEISFYRTFYQLTEDAQRLFTRCVMRKGELFRLDKFNYKEIKHLSSAKEELIEFELMEELKESVNEGLIRLFNKKEILMAFEQKEWKTLKRHELEQAVINYSIESVSSNNIDGFQKLLSDVSIVKVKMEIFDVFRLLFFGNLRQDLTEFVLQDLGLIHYPSYQISETNLPIQTREEIKVLTKLHELSEMFHDLSQPSIDDLKQLTSMLPENPDTSPLIRRRFDRLAYSIARHYERLKDYQSAVTIYKRCIQQPAKERFIRCLDYMGDTEHAWKELDLLNRSCSTGLSKQFANVFGKKLARKLPVNFEPELLQCRSEEHIVLEKNQPYVELDVIQHFINQGKAAFWIENQLFNSLFALFYWDLVYADVNGAFHNPFQSAPNDLYEREFLERRKSILIKLEEGYESKEKFWQKINNNRHVHNGEACRLIYWPCLDASLSDFIQTKSKEKSKLNESTLFELASTHIPIQDLRNVFEHLLSDLKEHRSGMPDLIIFDENRYELIEVKGPGDRLQNNQKVWMDFYCKNDIPHRILRVEYESVIPDYTDI